VHDEDGLKTWAALALKTGGFENKSWVFFSNTTLIIYIGIGLLLAFYAFSTCPKLDPTTCTSPHLKIS
jgi:hypothetical protein